MSVPRSRFIRSRGRAWMLQGFETGMRWPSDHFAFAFAFAHTLRLLLASDRNSRSDSKGAAQLFLEQKTPGGCFEAYNPLDVVVRIGVFDSGKKGISESLVLASFSPKSKVLWPKFHFLPRLLEAHQKPKIDSCLLHTQSINQSIIRSLSQSLTLFSLSLAPSSSPPSLPASVFPTFLSSRQIRELRERCASLCGVELTSAAIVHHVANTQTCTAVRHEQDSEPVSSLGVPRGGVLLTEAGDGANCIEALERQLFGVTVLVSFASGANENGGR
jgi:hypothetical protein